MIANQSGSPLRAVVWLSLAITVMLACGSALVGQTVTDVVVSSSSTFNLETDSLTCSFTLGGGAGAAATAWYLDGSPFCALYLPIEGGTGNALNDLSGNGVAVTAPENDPVFTANGGYDGVSSAGQFGLNAYYSAGETFPTNSPYTIMMWVYRTGSGVGGGGNLMSGDIFSGGHVFWAPDNEDKKLSAGHNGNFSLVQDTDSLNLNTWYHVALTWDDVSGEMVLYKNGVAIDQATTMAAVTDPTLFIGAYDDGYEWEGLLDDIRLYTRVLTPEQINAYYGGGAGDPDIIVEEEVELGQTWHTQVTPFSTNVQGVTVASNSVVIGSGPTPALQGLTLESTSGSFLTTDALTVTYTLDLGATSSATAWYRDGSPIMTVYIPGEGDAPAALQDYSGNGQAVTPTATPPVFAMAGGHDAVGGALAFDDGQSLTLGEIMPLNSSYTKACWIYRSGAGISNGGNLISGDSGPGHVFWAPNIHNWHLSAGHSNPWNQAQDSTGIIELNTWYHVAVTFDASNGLMTLFKDGVVVDTVTQPANTTDATLNIGAYAGGYEWQGLMEDIRVYPEALSSEQIASLYASGGDEIVAEETSIGEMWSAVVTPFSDTQEGTPETTLTETIIATTPSVPLLLDPPVEPDSILYDLTPVFDWSDAVSPDPDDTLYYKLIVSTDQDFLLKYEVDSLETSSYDQMDSLDFDRQYWWKVVATNRYGNSVVSGTSSFYTWTLGDMNHSHSTSLTDLTLMVNALFLNGAAITPSFVGDVTGDCTINLTDLTRLVNFLFLSGIDLTPGCE